MNNFDERYDIRLAKEEDIPMIMNMIKKYWSRKHILAENREFFEYEYMTGSGVNMLLAVDKNTGILEAFFGFIPCSSTKDSDKKDIWGSMWLVREDGDNIPLLGIELAKRITTVTEARYQIGNGANEKTTIPLRKLFFREKTGKMKQYYRYNELLKDYKLIKLYHKNNQKYVQNNMVKIIELRSMEDFGSKFNLELYPTVPYKDSWYVNRRFYDHPYYEYELWGIEENGECKAVVVTRVVEACGSKALRIVDYYGEQKVFSFTGKFWEDLLNSEKYEYVDFYEHGFNENAILDAGFSLREDDDQNIVPNYYEPFVQANVENWIHYKDENTLFFKADGDQDRPNIIE